MHEYPINWNAFNACATEDEQRLFLITLLFARDGILTDPNRLTGMFEDLTSRPLLDLIARLLPSDAALIQRNELYA